MTGPNILHELEQVSASGLRELDSIESEEALLAWRNTYLGKNALVMKAFSMLGTLPSAERPLVGQAANRAKVALEAAYTQRAQVLKETA
ncbi:MAG TPA: phenylalanine--tRNA ligase subunit alpha, partial [Anaerolineaceae bacterium]|nr:phenylalanine--tRNA ligase subunit alpha [Anaerolineaceae bacterium]